MRPLPRATALMGRQVDVPRPARSAQTTGILLLLGSVLMFTLMDATGKHLTQHYHPAQVVWTRLAINLAIVVVVLAPRLRTAARSSAPALQVGRGLTQLASIALFFTSLQFIGLAEATAIMDINPVLITLAAALFLREKIGPRRIVGIAVALTGAIIVIRPGAGVFQPAAILPLIGAFSYAAGAVMTRMVRGDSTATSILWSTAVATLGASLVAPFVWQPVQTGDLLAFAGIGILGTVAQALLIKAFTLAEAAAVAPFGYTGLIWAGIWGWLFFDKVPDLWTVVGRHHHRGRGPVCLGARGAGDAPGGAFVTRESPTATDRLGSALFIGLVRAMRLLPYRRRIPAMGWAFAHVAAPLAGWRRRIRANLALARPDLSPAEVRRLTRAVPDNAGRAMMEIYSGMAFVRRVDARPIR